MENVLRATLLAIVTISVGTAAHAGQLTIDRIYGGGSLSGPTPVRLKISPDGARVTFLRAKADDQDTFDL